MVQIINCQANPILFTYGKNTYHMWNWRTLTIFRKGTYQAKVKQGQLGWYTPDGWLSSNQVNKAIECHKQTLNGPSAPGTPYLGAIR